MNAPEPIRERVPGPRGRYETPTTAPRDDATTVLSYLFAGPLTFGGLGWAADHVLGTGFFIPIGVLAGLTLGIYVIWLRYGGS